MNEQEFVLGILDDILNYQYHISTTSLAARLMQLKVEHDSFIMDNAYHRCLSAVLKCGEVIENDFDNQLILAHINIKGIVSMPCVLSFHFDEDRAYINAYAKEYPHTPNVAIRALQKLKQSL